MSDLEPISPHEAVRLYLEHREPDLSEKSLTNHRYRLESFAVWCRENDLENLNELTGRDLHRFRVDRRRGEIGDYDPVSPITLRGILQTLRVFLEWAASVDAVEQGIREKVLLPEVDREDESKDEFLDEEPAKRIIDYLDEFRYASREHVVIALLWNTGMRLGALRALDVEDVNLEESCLELRHRPEEGTPLKNRRGAERTIAIGEYYLQVLEDYIEHTRHDVVDEFGRRPLITSEQGRLSESPIRRLVYQWTRPCMVGECPHDEDPKTCEFMTRDTARDCPSSRSPHGVRRGSITSHLRDGTPREVVSDRMNVSAEVLEQHYDETTEMERMRIRREFLRRRKSGSPGGSSSSSRDSSSHYDNEY